MCIHIHNIIMSWKYENYFQFKYFQLLQPQWAGRLTRLSNIIITLCPHDASLLTLLVDLARFLCTYGVRMLCNWPNFSMTENRHRNASSVHDFTVFNQQVSKKRFSAFYPPLSLELSLLINESKKFPFMLPTALPNPGTGFSSTNLTNSLLHLTSLSNVSGTAGSVLRKIFAVW